MYIHIYIYIHMRAHLGKLKRDNVVYWKTKRKIKNDLQWKLELQQEKDADNPSLKDDIERAINRQDKRGRTPLHAAASGNQRSDNGAVLCASRLIDAGASTSLLDLKGQLMLQIMGSDRTLKKRKAYTCVFTSVHICVTCVCAWVRVCSCTRV